MVRIKNRIYGNIPDSWAYIWSKDITVKNRKLVVTFLVVGLVAISQQITAKNDDDWGWSGTIIAGALIGGLTGKVVYDVVQGASTSWNHSYISAVRDRTDRYEREYSGFIDTVRFSSSKKLLAREFSEKYRSVSGIIYDFKCATTDFDGAILGLESKVAEWRSQNNRQSMCREGRDVLEDAYPLQTRLRETNNSLQSQQYYLVLYDVVCHRAPELKRHESYPYHVLLNDCESAKNELKTAISDLEHTCCLDILDRELREKAQTKLDRLSEAYTRVIESSQYHHEKLEKLREQRHRELMEAQRRLEQAELERARAERERAQAERERARVEWERQERDLIRLKRELRELEEQQNHCTQPSYDYVDISVHIDV